MDDESRTVGVLIPRRVVIAKVRSGEVAIERGADGVYLRFDCDCLDALPYCQAQCCALKGTVVHEFDKVKDEFLDIDETMDALVMKRDSDGYCTCLDRDTRLCTINDHKPQTCRAFHCTRGANMRGWKLSNAVYRQSQS